MIDAFRLINPNMMVLGQEPRQTTSNLGHLNKPSIQVCMCMRTSVCVCVCVWECVRTCMHASVCVCVCAHAYSCTCIGVTCVHWVSVYDFALTAKLICAVPIEIVSVNATLQIYIFFPYVFKALIHGLNRHYYSLAINYRKNELEQKVSAGTFIHFSLCLKR